MVSILVRLHEKLNRLEALRTIKWRYGRYILININHLNNYLTMRLVNFDSDSLNIEKSRNFVF